jgi:hypothetical protein
MLTLNHITEAILSRGGELQCQPPSVTVVVLPSLRVAWRG